MSAAPTVSAFFPCYDDAPTICGLVERVSAALDEVGIDHEVIVVDDGSTDDSVARLERLAAAMPRLRIVRHPQNRGYGGALLSGFAASTGEWVFYTDGDGQYDPDEVRLLVARMSPDVDVVQGWKIRRQDPWPRRMIGRLYHHAVRAAFALPVRDTDCDFRLIRRSLLDRVRLEHTSGVICVEMLRKFSAAGARFVEVPVHHYPRLHGRSQFFRLSRVARTLTDLGGLWVGLVLRGGGSSGAAGPGKGKPPGGR
ncbi:MAG: glycosyltransferase family 2 protein [Alphaproteobacteria bacterium]